MTSALITKIDRSDRGFVTVVTADGFHLLGDYLSSDLVGVDAGPFPDAYAAALRGLQGLTSDPITGNTCTVCVVGVVTVVENDYDGAESLTLPTADFKEALDTYAAWATRGHWLDARTE